MIPSPAHQATGRQRGDGSLPSGNNKSRKVVGIKIRIVHHQEPNHAAVSPRLLGPKSLALQDSAYPLAKMPRPTSRPMVEKIQPMGLLGRWEATMAPTTAKISSMAKVRITSSAPKFRTLRSVRPAVRDKVYPPTKRITEITTSDQASRVAVRVLIPPTLRSWSIVPFVTTPLYSTTVSPALRQPLRGRGRTNFLERR